jgi:hypothetical protein
MAAGATFGNWNPMQQPVNKFLLCNTLSPGICRGPTGAAVNRKLDEQKGFGIDGAFLIFTGRELAEFSTELLLITPKDWAYWQEWRQLVHEVPVRGPVSDTKAGYVPGKALQIWHPQLSPLGITQCVVISEPQEEIDDYMVGHVVLKFKQIRTAPKPAYAKPEAAKAEPEKTEEERYIEKLAARNALASKEQADKAAGA